MVPPELRRVGMPGGGVSTRLRVDTPPPAVPTCGGAGGAAVLACSLARLLACLLAAGVGRGGRHECRTGRLEGRDVGLVTQGDADVVQTLEESPADVVVDLERGDE